MRKIRWTVLAKRSVTCIVAAIVMLIADYLLSNARYPLFDDVDTFKYLGFFQRESGRGTDSHFPDSIMCINLAYDKALAPVIDPDFGDTIGHEAVTDRRALSEILRLADKASPGHVFMDVRFSNADDRPEEQSLFKQIGEMRCITVSAHVDSDMSGLPLSFVERTALADYRGKKGAGFTRYEFVQDDGPSVAARMFHEMDGEKIERHKFYASSRGRLCYNSQFIVLPCGVADAVADDGRINYPYWTGHIRSSHTDEEIMDMMRGKTVIIGDFDNDVHDSYIGPCPGPLLNYFALRSLQNEDHLYKWGPMLLLGLIYALMLVSFLWPAWPDSGSRASAGKKIAVAATELLASGGILIYIKIAYFLIWHISVMAVVPAAALFVAALWRRFRAHISISATADEIPSSIADTSL